jgi:hypothetical protein
VCHRTMEWAKRPNCGRVLTMYFCHTCKLGCWPSSSQLPRFAFAMKNGGPSTWQAMLAMIDQAEGALAAVESRLPQSFPSRTWTPYRRGCDHRRTSSLPV